MTINDVGKRTGSSNYGRIRSRAAHLEADEEKGKRLGGRAVRSKGESGEDEFPRSLVARKLGERGSAEGE